MQPSLDSVAEQDFASFRTPTIANCTAVLFNSSALDMMTDTSDSSRCAVRPHFPEHTLHRAESRLFTGPSAPKRVSLRSATAVPRRDRGVRKENENESFAVVCPRSAPRADAAVLHDSKCTVAGRRPARYHSHICVNTRGFLINPAAAG